MWDSTTLQEHHPVPPPGPAAARLLDCNGGVRAGGAQGSGPQRTQPTQGRRRATDLQHVSYTHTGGASQKQPQPCASRKSSCLMNNWNYVAIRMCTVRAGRALIG